MNDQPSLFPLEPVARESATSALAAAVEARDERCRALQARLPLTLRMGTSSWSFPGWAGIVYPRSVPASVLARDGLRELGNGADVAGNESGHRLLGFAMDDE